MSKYGFGIIGCGVISDNHARAIDINERAELIAVCDVIEEKALDLKGKYDVPYHYSDYKEMLKRKDIDIICICTPSGMHSQMTIDAAKSGKHVFCEKPIDITKDKISKMIESCRNNNVKLGCVFQRRLMPEAVAVKKALANQKLGKMVLADAYMKYYRSPEYYDSADWRGTWELDGGGALMNQGVHGIDLLLWLAGDVKSIQANTGNLARDIEVEDTAVALLEFKNGAYGVIEGTTSVYPAQKTRIEIHGREGTIIFGDSGFERWQTLADEKDTFPDFESEKVGGSSDPKDISISGHIKLIDDMVSAVEEDRNPLITGESARKAVDLILAIYESSKTGKKVYL